MQQCWHSKVERLPLSPFLSSSIAHLYTQPSDTAAQRVAVAHSTVVQKLRSWNDSSVTSAASCQSGFISLQHAPESLRLNCLSGPCQLQSLPCIFNEATFVCVCGEKKQPTTPNCIWGYYSLTAVKQVNYPSPGSSTLWQHNTEQSINSQYSAT